METRKTQEIAITFAAGATASRSVAQLERGCFGTFIVPSGSEAIAKTIQFTATSGGTSYPNTALLAAAKLLAAGANHLTVDEVAEAGAAKDVIFTLSAPVVATTTIWLLWKA